MKENAIVIDDVKEETPKDKAPKEEKVDNRIGATRGAIATIVMLLPYLLSFFVFIVLPVALAIILSFTNFNSMTFPQFVGFDNYINLFTGDTVFMQKILPNTIVFAFICGPVGYILSFLLTLFIFFIFFVLSCFRAEKIS